MSVALSSLSFSSITLNVIGRFQVPKEQEEPDRTKASHQRGDQESQKGQGEFMFSWVVMCVAERMLSQLDPANNKSVIDLQKEAADLRTQPASAKNKGKQKAAQDLADSDDPDVDMADLSDDPAAGDDAISSTKPMPSYESISTLRSKLHARIDSFKRDRGAPGEPDSRDELLEEQRRKRGLLRENRRQATRERKRKEEAGKPKKPAVQDRDKGHQTKVRIVTYRRWLF